MLDLRDRPGADHAHTKSRHSASRFTRWLRVKFTRLLGGFEGGDRISGGRAVGQLPADPIGEGFGLEQQGFDEGRVCVWRPRKRQSSTAFDPNTSARQMSPSGKLRPSDTRPVVPADSSHSTSRLPDRPRPEARLPIRRRRHAAMDVLAGLPSATGRIRARPCR